MKKKNKSIQSYYDSLWPVKCYSEYILLCVLHGLEPLKRLEDKDVFKTELADDWKWHVACIETAQTAIR